MKPIVLMLSLIFGACLLAGVFGAVHDQISYGTSPDYFHHFKFHQFAVPADFQNRFGAALVGWQASWWMGLFLGLPIALASLRMPTRALQIKAFWRVAIAIMCVTLLAALLTLPFDFSAALEDQVFIPTTVADKASFLRVGVMHSMSYLAGALAAFVGLIFLLIWTGRERRTAALQ